MLFFAFKTKKQQLMKNLKIIADQLLCTSCGTPIPKGQSKCINPNCPTKKTLLRENNKTKLKFQEVL